ncbi:MAG: hypothetical protein LBR16_07490 [Treponema sp.]|jgi:hypothetical protein|nr:hypothetical protein [Treponema sp.]
MWAAGAVCFFAAWGRSGTLEPDAAYSLDLVVGLILIMLLCDWIIVGPVLRMLFRRRAESEAAPHRGLVHIFVRSLLHIVKVTAIIVCIVATYFLLNTALIRVFKGDRGAVPLPLEPLLFGVLYGLYSLAFDTIAAAARRARRGRRHSAA